MSWWTDCDWVVTEFASLDAVRHCAEAFASMGTSLTLSTAHGLDATERKCPQRDDGSIVGREGSWGRSDDLELYHTISTKDATHPRPPW